MEKALKLIDYVGLDPQKTDSFSLYKRVISFVLVLFIIISAFIEFILNLDKAEAIERSAESFIAQLESAFRMSNLLICKKQFNTLITNLKYFWKPNEFGTSHEKKLQQKQRYVDLFFYTYAILMYISSILYTLISYFLLPRRTMFLCYGTIDGNLPPAYFIANYIVQISAFTVICTVVTAYDALFFYFACYIYTEFKLLKIAFQQLNINTTSSYGKKLIEAIKHHDFILTYVKNLNDIYSPLFLFQYFSNFSAICFGLFIITRNGMPPDPRDVLQFAPAVCAFIVQAFIFCKIGNLIIDLSVDITEVLFYADWMSNEVYETKTERLIILNRALKPAKLTVGKFTDLDLRTFILVMRSAYSFLAFVNNFLN